MKNILYLLLILLAITSCKTNENKPDQTTDKSISVANDLSSNQARVFSLPSPFQVSAIIKLIGIDYNEKFTENTVHNQNTYSSPTYQALNLGVNYVDIYYSTVYEKYETSAAYLEKIENLMYDLGLKTKKDYKLIDRFEKNIHNKDSLDLFIKMYQNDIQDYYNISEEKQIAFIIMSGIYFEGLYLLTNIYEDNFKNKMLTSFMDNSIKKVLFQQANIADNLIELLSSYNDNKNDFILEKLKTIQTEFNNMKIEYSSDSNNNITDVKISKKHIHNLMKVSTDIRNSFIAEKK
ncbi:MAG: hypothetical protein A2033_05995 [Bacteroidetes bacterium GWA2_31_9]|nr:MAG: hypothetical protein A2033_05995 [Bacteroidetes bacterium GWA2_31_9]